MSSALFYSMYYECKNPTTEYPASNKSPYGMKDFIYY